MQISSLVAMSALVLSGFIPSEAIGATHPSLSVESSFAKQAIAQGIKADTLVRMAELAWDAYKTIRGQRTPPASPPVQGATPQVLFFTYPVSTVVATSQWVPVGQGIMAATNNYGGWAYYYASNGQLYGFSALNKYTGKLDTYYANGWRVPSEVGAQ